jgi:hypothetical protein
MCRTSVIHMFHAWITYVFNACNTCVYPTHILLIYMYNTHEGYTYILHMLNTCNIPKNTTHVIHT